ncbi:TPA: bacteriocin immunity protein [Streptococcus pneumoniae]
MVEPNLESLIKDLYNHARHDLSEDLVAALLETAKKLPTTNEQLQAVRLSGLVNRELLLNPKHPAPELLLNPKHPAPELLLNPKHPAPELLNLARFIKREEAKYRGTATSALMYEELFKML